MESSAQLETDSKSSSEDESMDVRPDSGRSYECVFCKRGFTTAQALGGHMNIHRKDRAKTGSRKASIPSVASKVLDEANYSYFSPPIQTFPHYYSMFQEVNTSDYTLFPAGSWGLVRPPAVMEGRCLNLIGEATLSLRIGPSSLEIEGEEEDKKLGNDGLDLELRLGHDP